jgi:hypothetical protein
MLFCACTRLKEQQGSKWHELGLSDRFVCCRTGIVHIKADLLSTFSFSSLRYLHPSSLSILPVPLLAISTLHIFTMKSSFHLILVALLASHSVLSSPMNPRPVRMGRQRGKMAMDEGNYLTDGRSSSLADSLITTPRRWDLPTRPSQNSHNNLGHPDPYSNRNPHAYGSQLAFSNPNANPNQHDTRLSFPNPNANPNQYDTRLAYPNPNPNPYQYDNRLALPNQYDDRLSTTDRVIDQIVDPNQPDDLVQINLDQFDRVVNLQDPTDPDRIVPAYVATGDNPAGQLVGFTRGMRKHRYQDTITQQSTAKEAAIRQRRRRERGLEGPPSYYPPAGSQGYPPQGYPNQGYGHPAQGHLPQDYPPHGNPQHGYSPQGQSGLPPNYAPSHAHPQGYSGQLPPPARGQFQQGHPHGQYQAQGQAPGQGSGLMGQYQGQGHSQMQMRGGQSLSRFSPNDYRDNQEYDSD